MIDFRLSNYKIIILLFYELILNTGCGQKIIAWILDNLFFNSITQRNITTQNISLSDPCNTLHEFTHFLVFGVVLSTFYSLFSLHYVDELNIDSFQCRLILGNKGKLSLLFICFKSKLNAVIDTVHVSILDLIITKLNNKFQYQIYHKPATTDMINAEFHHTFVKNGSI